MRSARMIGPFTDPAGYDRHTRGVFGRLHARVVEDVLAADLPDEARLLDVGAGPGRVPRALAAARPTWTVDAVDLDPAMVAYGRRLDPDGRVRFAVGDAADLPYPDDGFDLVVTSLSQHHWTNVEGALRELHRVLRPGGRLWIYDARFVLRRAVRAARRSFADPSVHRELVLTGRSPFAVFARVVAQA
jgi:ubiquinone/menaquinone biosynthesis C-methylase UbiE